MIERVLHQLLADTFALRGEVDRDRPDAGNITPHVQEVRAARHAVIEGGDAVYGLLLHQQPDDALRELDAVEVGREPVRLGDVPEGLVADAPQLGDVLGLRAAKFDAHGGLLGVARR